MKRFLISFLVMSMVLAFAGCNGGKGGVNGDADSLVVDSMRYGGRQCLIFVSEFTDAKCAADTSIADGFGGVCAKIVVSAPDVKDFNFDFGLLRAAQDVMDSTRRVLFVPAGIKIITMDAPKYGSLYYEVHREILPGRTYNLVLMEDYPEDEVVEGSDAEDTFNKGVDHAENGYYSLAFQYYKKAAEGDYAGAMNNLSVCYLNGEGVAIDYVESHNWFLKSAELGDDIAQYNVAKDYILGRGTEVDEAEAKNWAEKSAEQGDKDGQRLLGDIYYDAGDVKEAMHYYTLAAEQGDKEAQHYMYVSLIDGDEGVQKDSKKAIEWLRKSAEQNYAPAQCDLGGLYDDGKYIETDYSKAVMWYERAASQGYAAAFNLLAYCYAKGNGVEQDMDYALYLIDEAINRSKDIEDVVYYMDTKGEFCLMMHKEKEARAIWKRMMQLDADYVKSDIEEISTLYSFIKSGKNPY